MEYFICFRCLTVNKREDLRPSGKIKGLTLEASKKHKQCRNCKCKTFYKVEKSDDS